MLGQYKVTMVAIATTTLVKIAEGAFNFVQVFFLVISFFNSVIDSLK